MLPVMEICDRLTIVTSIRKGCEKCEVHWIIALVVTMIVIVAVGVLLHVI